MSDATTLASSLYVGCFVVPGKPTSLGQRDWLQCREAAIANNAPFFGYTAWHHHTWYAFCILVSQLYTDIGDEFEPAVGATCSNAPGNIWSTVDFSGIFYVTASGDSSATMY